MGASGRRPYARLLSVLTGPRRPYVAGDVIHEIVSTHAASMPDRVAARDEHSELTYGDLDRRARAVAAELQNLGVGPGSVVGIRLNREIELPVAALGVLHSGAAYIALDDAWPAARRSRLLSSARASLVISSDAQAVDELPLQAIGLKRLEGPGPTLHRRPAVDGRDPFSVFSTSGSTGEPKGVVVSHRSLVRIAVNVGFAQYDAETVVLQSSPLPWDMFAFELWMPLLNGGCVVLATDRHLTAPALKRAVSRDGVNTLYLTASLLNTLIDEDVSAFAGIRVMITGGERASLQHLRRLLNAHPGLHLVHGYGPAEAVCTATAHVISQPDTEPGAKDLPIGRPVPNTDVYLMRDATDGPPDHPVERGQTGELCIGGDALAIGYLDADPEMSARFAIVEVAGVGTRRLYRTGDLALQRDDGELVFLGRKDRQVKIRGHRVEPGEVEAALLTIDGIRNAAVVAVERTDGDHVEGLAAYCVVEQGCELSGEDVLRRLAAFLPEHMLPVWYVPLEEMPLSPSGKVDRKGLRPPLAGERVAGRMESPVAPSAENAGPDVRLIAELTGSVLGLGRVGPDDDFLSLGGDSLLATRLAGRIWDAFGKEVRVTDILEARTSRLLAQRVLGYDQAFEEQPDTSVVAWPVPASDAQVRFWLAESISPGTFENVVDSVYDIVGDLDADLVGAALADLTATHEVLRTAYVEESGRLSQILAKHAPAPLTFSDTDDPEILVQRAAEGIDLEGGKPIGAALCRRTSKHRLAIAVHHIATDAWSERVMLDHLALAYSARASNREPDLPQPLGYAAYSLWHERLLRRIEADQAAYWFERLRDTPALPWSDGRDESGDLARTSVVLSAETAADARRKARRLGVTPYAVLLSGFFVAIAQEARQSDFAIGIATSGRRHPAFEETMGCFVNTLAVRPRLDAANDFGDVVRAVGGALNSALVNEDLPFNRVVAAVNPSRNVTHPILQAYFTVQPLAANALRLPSMVTTRLRTQMPGGTAFDLYLELWTPDTAAEPFAGTLMYRPGIVPPDAAARIAYGFEEAVRGGSSTD